MKRAPRPPSICDAPGCTVEVRRGILMCRPHWFRTPRLLREAISAAWAEKRIRDWSAACLEARRWHRDNPPAAIAARITGDAL
ncbi:MAG: hypothetical protein JWN59_1754 [Sphingomonas bacterium]|nr:hypothetical protein [Sphingomonas bacterium]